MTHDTLTSGFVSIIGRPNVGKSTLLNAILAQKVSIVSNVPQTTRHLVRGILNTDTSQIVFVDSPGIHLFKERLSAHLNTVAKKALLDVELILYVVDVSRPPKEEEIQIMHILIRQKAKIIMAFNKMDSHRKYLDAYINLWKKHLSEQNIQKDPILYYMLISAKTGKNLDELIAVISKELPQGPAYYERNTVTDFPLKFRVADVIREKLFLRLQEELPHSLAVEVEEIEEKETLTSLWARIYVNRDSQKGILIGKKGEFIRDIGIAARKELEAIFKKKVYLELRVKVVVDWPKKMRILKELGYSWE